MKKQINIIGISGSLKSASANTNILQAIAAIVSPQVDFRIFEGIDMLPHFNPERTENNDTVEAFRAQIKKSDAVIISTPEYAFGVPGVLKNALDWLVSSGEMNEKPVAVISASPLYSGGDKALASLLLTLTALGTNIGADASVSIGNIKNKVNAAGAVTDKDTIHTLTMLLEKLLEKFQVNKICKHPTIKNKPMLKETLQKLFTRDLNKLKTEIELYNDESRLWEIEGNIANSAGNLCLHLIGNLNYFIGAEIGKTGYVRDRPAEFSTKNTPKTELIKKVEDTLLVVIESLDKLTPEQLESEYPIIVFGEKMSIEFFLVHLSGHLCYHLGQINYHRRLIDMAD